jgi:hypothetical protein
MAGEVDTCSAQEVHSSIGVQVLAQIVQQIEGPGTKQAPIGTGQSEAHLDWAEEIDTSFHCLVADIW